MVQALLAGEIDAIDADSLLRRSRPWRAQRTSSVPIMDVDRSSTS